MDDLVGAPPGDPGRVRRREGQDEVPEAGVDRPPRGLPGAARVVVGDRQDQLAGEGTGVASDVRAEMRGVGNLCIGAESDPAYDTRRLVGLLLAGLRSPPQAPQ